MKRTFNDGFVLVAGKYRFDNEMSLPGFNKGSNCDVTLVRGQFVRNRQIQIRLCAENLSCDCVGINDLYGFGAG